MSPQRTHIMILAVLVAVVYGSVNWMHSGPTYLADEIGYLANAAFLGGHVIDGASSYHAGYSILLAPLFWLNLEPSILWHLVILLNALFWGISLLLCDQIVQRASPEISVQKRAQILAIAALYPSWISITGYAFPTSLFVLVYLFSIVILVSERHPFLPKVFLFSLLSGFLYWIHPIGLATGISSFLTILVLSVRNGSAIPPLVHLITLLGTISFYKLGVEPWLQNGMTPEGFTALTHYPTVREKLELLTRQFFDPNPMFWRLWVGSVLGQIGYLVVGSLGLVALGVSSGLRQSSLFTRKSTQASATAVILIYSAISVVLISLMSGMPNVDEPSSSRMRIDHWIYGRYVDCAVMPLLIIGGTYLNQVERYKKYQCHLMSVVFLLLVGILIDQMYDSSQPNNLVNTASFWPQYLSSDFSFFTWFSISALALSFLTFFGPRMFLACFICIFILGTYKQINWHKNQFNFWSKPSSIVSIVEAFYAPGACLGFDADFPQSLSLKQAERFNLYKFYFYKFAYRRIQAIDWMSDCNGPLLSYNGEALLRDDRIYLVARETETGLFLATKNAEVAQSITRRYKSSDDIFVGQSYRDNCIDSGCYRLSATSLIQFSQVGQLADKSISSIDKDGYLFFGPYRTLKSGSYELIIAGDFLQASNVIVDVVSNRGANVIMREPLCAGDCSKTQVSLAFDLSANATDLEVRMYVTSEDRVAVEWYEIRTK